MLPVTNLFFCADTGLGCTFPQDRSDVDAFECTSDKRLSDGSSGFDSVFSSSVDTAPEATIRDSDDEISSKTETESDSLFNSDNEQLVTQKLDEQETVGRLNLIQPVQNDDCTFQERNRKFHAEKCRSLKGPNKDRPSMEKEQEHIARNVQLVHADAPVIEYEAMALPEGNSGSIICPRNEPQKAMTLSLWGQNVMSAAPGGRKRETTFYVNYQNNITASQRCEKNAATGSHEFYRYGTMVCCKDNQTGAAEVQVDQEVVAVRGMGQEGGVSRKYEQPKIKELLPEYREENERNKHEKEKHNKEEQEEDALEVPEFKEQEEKRGRIENEKADKGKNKDSTVGQTPVYEKKINEDKVRDNYLSVFSSSSSSGEKRSKWYYRGHSKKLQKQKADWQQYSLSCHPSRKNDPQPQPETVRCSFQLTDKCWSFEYFIVSGI